MTLPQLRAELASALEAAGLSVVDREPARLSPPVAVISPGSPYVGEADTFGSARKVRMRLRLVVPQSDGALAQLEELIEQVIPAVELIGDTGEHYGDRWDVLDVGEPYTLIIGTTAFPAVDVSVATSAPFTY